jgi:integrase
LPAQFEPALDTAVWLEIEGFVGDAVAGCADATAYTVDTLNIAASRLTAWCWQTGGMELDRETIFARDTIAHFVAVGLPHSKPAARGNLRSQLLRMSEVLLGRTVSLRKLGALPPSDPSAPYSAAEITSLRNWADAQSTSERRTNARVLNALGMGAGLSASEIGETRIRDIMVDDRGVTVDVTGDRARPVPVLRDWEDALIERGASPDRDRYAFRENRTGYFPNLISNFARRSQWTLVLPQSQRMRATWIVHHLSAGTPVVPLMRAAGVESLEAFTRYVRFVQPLSPETERAALSGL